LTKDVKYNNNFVDDFIMITSCEAKKASDVLCALFNGRCPNDDSLLEKLRTWLESSLNDAGSHLA